MPKVEISCPLKSCGKLGNLDVKEELIANSARGVTAINVGENMICRHSFIIYIDRNFDIRDAFLTDFTIELPIMEIKESSHEESPENYAVDLYLITINVPSLVLMYIVRCIMNNKKIIYLVDVPILKEYLMKFFNIILVDSFEKDIIFLTNEEYQNDKKLYKNHIIFNNTKIYSDKTKFLNPKTMRVERTIIQKFLSESDTKSSLIILKSEFQKAYILAKDLSEKIQELSTLEQKEQIDAKFFYGFLEEKYNTKISLPYLKFLIEIVENYFSVLLPMMWKFFILRL